MKLRAATLLIAIWSIPRIAAADVTPPPGYVERCTLENAEADGDECVMLSHWAFDGRCVKFLADQGFCNRCGMGATMRDEIFCRKPGAASLPADWTTQCLSGTDPRTLDPKERPRLPQVAQCPAERTRSTGPDDPARAEDERSGCGCGVTGSGPVGLWALTLVALLARRRRQ